MNPTALRLLQATRSTSSSTAGRLLFDRDYHIHLGGAIPLSLIKSWVRDGKLTLNDEISDLVVATSCHLPSITVRRAFEDYRGFATSKQMNDVDIYAAAYNTRQYDSLPVFLTLYRAFSKRNLLYLHAREISRGEFVHPNADVRVSIPHPNNETNTISSEESPTQYAQRAIEEMVYFQSCLLPTQRLFITFPRQTFNVDRNLEYFNAFIDLLTDTNTLADGDPTHQLAFDFAGQPLPTTQTLPLLDNLRNAFPSSFICYHHGEVCPGIAFSDRIKHTFDLIPYVNRIGHGLCLGLAVLGIDPDFTDVNAEVQRKAPLHENKEQAYHCLQQLADQKIGIEISPSCNITLGGAMSEEILTNYVREFLKMGVDVSVGTDDPGFLNTSMDKEISILQNAGLC